MLERSESWLVSSRLVGVLPLSDGRVVAAHILGRSWTVFDSSVASLLDYFAVPQRPRALREPVDAPHDLLDSVLDQLLDAGILRRAGSNEVERIRGFYREKLREATPSRTVDSPQALARPRWLVPTGGIAPEALTQTTGKDECLVLSAALATLAVGEDEMLVTHPLHAAVHMTGELWRLARLFEHPLQVTDALEAFSRVGISEGRALNICAFFRRAFLLWPSREAEASTAAELAGLDDMTSLRVERPVANRWRQKFAPYTVNDAARCDAAGEVALIGPCHLQLAAEALQVLAQREGISLDVTGMLDPGDSDLSRAPWSAVVLSATQYAASLYEAIAATDLPRVERLAISVAARIDEAVDRIRAVTAAPLIVTSISAPGLPPTGAESAFWHATNAALARLNAAVASRLGRLNDAWLLDEGRLAAEMSSGFYWDDEFNALPHHSAVSSWSWLVVKPEVVDDERASNVAPVPDPAQIDPAVVLASGILRVIERRYVARPVRLIVFEPNNLLWRGRLEDRAAAYPTPPHFYADVEDYLYAGIHEALAVLRRKGILLACASTCPTEQLLARWATPSTLQHLVRCEDLVAVEGGGSWSDRLQRLLTRVPVPEEDVLVIDFPAPQFAHFRGRTYQGAPFGLRRFLLTSPELNPLPEGAVSRDGSEIHSSAAARANEPADALAPDGTSEQEVYRAIAATVGASLSTVAECDDLRRLGVDSLGAVDVMTALEHRFGISFDDHQRVGPIMFVPAALSAAVREAARQRRTRHVRRSQSPSRDCYGDSSYEAWCAGDLASIIASHIESPRVPWIFKVVASTAPFDVEFLSWKQVGALAHGYAAAYTSAGLSPGERVAIAIPHGTGLIGAMVGAILGRFVACVLPPMATSTEALRDTLNRIRPRAVVCDEQHRETPSALRAAGFAGEIIRRTQPADIAAVWPPHAGPGTPLLLQQSSGTTRGQKALLLDDRCVLSQVWQIAHAVGCMPADRVATWLPMYHDMGFICTLVLPLALSLPTVVISPYDWVAHPELLLREISDEQATIAWMPNFAFAHAARRVDERSLSDVDLSSLRVLVNGGEPVTQQAMNAFLRRFGPYGLRASALTTGYGAAEATAAITQSSPGRSALSLRVDARMLEEHDEIRLVTPDAPIEDVRQLVSSGTVLSHTQIRIVDVDGNSLGDGKIGEIVVSGDAIASEYEADEEASAKSFRHGKFHSGDLGFRLGEEIFVTGRKDDVIAVAGRKIYPHHVEDTAADVEGIYPGRTVMFGVPTADDSTQKLVLLAESQSDELADDKEEQLRSAVASRVFDEWRLPVTVVILERGTLIKTTSGKVSRSRNRTLYLERLRALEPAR
jgi:acyl-CoA synthetase (AMP-forming)/AMP-acid ligase II/acyl carrier protein